MSEASTNDDFLRGPPEIERFADVTEPRFYVDAPEDFHVVLTGLPSGVTYTPGSISINFGTGQTTAPYTIATNATAAVGVHTFTAEYQFHNVSHVLLATHTLTFTIEVLP